MNPPRYEKDFTITLAQVAVLCNVLPSTTRQWRARGVMPPSDAPEAPEPMWWVSTIMSWASVTGRATDLPALLEAVKENAQRERGRPASTPDTWQRKPVWRGGMAMAEPADLSGLGRPLAARDTSEQGLCTEPI